MVDIERETNPERLRRLALLQHAQIKHLVSELHKKDAQLAKLTGRTSNLALELATIAAMSEESEPPAKPTPPDRRKTPAEAKPQKGHGPTAQPELQHVVEDCKLDEADRTCPSCGGALVEMKGQFDTTEVVDVIEVQYRVVEARLQKYRCGCGGCVDTALPNDKVPERNIEGGRYSVAFAAKVATDKYVHHLPLERQVRMMAQHGLFVTSQALWDQLMAMAMELQPTWMMLHAALMKEPVIGVDQTGWPNLEDRTAKKWQMWCIVAPKLVYHRICDDKSAATFRELLGNYHGTAVSDQASTNHAGAREGPMKLVGCWAHIYRKFAEAEPDYPEAAVILGLIGELYAVDRRATSDLERAELRRTESRAIIARIKTWLESVTVIGATALGAAVKHTVNVWPRLIAFLEDPRIWLDNNPTERGLRGPVVGRRNHFGSKSRRGTEVAAILYSLVETAKVCGIDPAKYLVEAHAAARRGAVLLPAALADNDQTSES